MQKEPLSFFDKLSEAVGWIGIVASPFLLFGVAGLIVYAGGGGGLVAVLLAVAGLFLGILLASRIAARSGTVEYLSRVSATPELDHLQGIYSAAYSFMVRPEYGSDQLLIEFMAVLYGGETFEPMKLIGKLKRLLSKNGFKEDHDYQQPVPVELHIRMVSENGVVLIHLDSWDLVFILGENNQQAILTVEYLLQESPHFKQLKATNSTRI